MEEEREEELTPMTLLTAEEVAKMPVIFFPVRRKPIQEIDLEERKPDPNQPG